MAEMIPPAPLDSSPPGEIELFHALERDPIASEWIVLQGLVFVDHPTQVMGEIDFVVLVPGHGILVVEVKSHTAISRDQLGRWKLGSMAWTTRSPFKQVSDERFAFLKWLRSQNMPSQTWTVWGAVWFTSLMSSHVPKSTEWHEWELLDARDLRLGAAAAVLRVLEAAKNKLQSHVDGVLGSGPSTDEVRQVASRLRREFESVQSATDAAKDRTKELAKFLPEQLRVLDFLKRAPRVLIEGRAGTGKTFVAIEAARRSSDQGQKTLVVVFNRLLARELASHPDLQNSSVEVSTIHSLLMRLARVTKPGRGDNWWRSELPDLALEKLVESGAPPEYDVLVVDEVQDVFVGAYPSILDLLLKGGLRGGRSTLTGDLASQAIYAGVDDPRAMIEQWIPDIFSAELTINCRSTQTIGSHANLLAKLVPGYTEYRRPEPGVPPKLDFVGPGIAFADRLKVHIQSYLDERYLPSEIVVLSPHAISSESTRSDPWLRDRMTTDTSDRTRIRIASIHEFKGLEAPVVIVTDLDSAQPGLHDLLYIAITRATFRLTLIARRTLMLELVGRSAAE